MGVATDALDGDRDRSDADAFPLWDRPLRDRAALIRIIVAIYRYAPTPGSAQSGNNLQ